MKVHNLVLEPKDIAGIIRNDWRGFDSKDYELVVALILAREYFKQTGKKYRIGFPAIRDSDKNISEVNIQSIIKLVRNYLEENHPIDFMLISEDDIKNKLHKGIAFQIKRFVNKSNDYTGSLVSYLNEKIGNHYAPVEATLIIVLGEGNLDLKCVKDTFKPNKYPFEKVFYTCMDSHSKFIIGELWPTIGRNEYSYDEWFENDPYS